MKTEQKSRDELINDLIDLCHKIRGIEQGDRTSALEPGAFQLTHRQYLDIIEFLPDATFVIDQEKRVIAWNGAIEEMTGVSKQDIIGKGDYAYSIPFYGERRPILVDLVFDVDVPLRERYHFVESDGKTYFAEVFAPRMYGGKGAYLWGKASPLFDQEGRIIGAIESIRDITDRRLAEDALRKSEQMFRMVVETMNEGLGVQDERGVIIYANDKLCRMLGYRRDELVGLSETSLFDEANRRRLEREMKRRRQLEATSYEVELLCRDGRKIPVIVSGAPLIDEKNRFRGTIGTVTDISTRKEAEKRLRESEEKYRTIFENSPLGIFHFDADGTVTACNDNIIEIWGSSKEKFIGFNLLTSLKNKKMRAAVSACLSGQSACYEGNYLSVTGGKFTNLKADYGPILSDDGSVLGGICIIEDVSERKQAQDALRESEKQLRFLSSQLLDTQEKERKRIARDLHDSIGSSLSAIKFSLENIFKRIRQGSASHESLKTIISMTQHAIEESRRIMTDLRPSMLDDLGIVATIGWFCRQFQKVYDGIRVESHIDVEEDEIPDNLKIVIFRVIQEAFHNIARHSEAGLVRISLDKKKDILHLVIKDDGVGFDPTSFSIEEANDKRGLGLPSMKERTELSGGEFFIRSAVGEGTEVSAQWPLGKGLGDSEIPPA